MKISIVVPVYNVERYLPQCVDSLLAQSYRELEIILVDDGSTDRSGQLCDAYGQRHPDLIRVVHKKNAGLGYARNTGLSHVTGDYVAFVDSDDYADPDMIENLVTAAKSYQADAVIGGFRKVNDQGDTLFVERYESTTYEGAEVPNRLLIRMLGSCPERSDAIRMSVWNNLYSLAIIKKYGIAFPSERDFISEDIIFDLDFYVHASTVCLIDSVSYCYRRNEHSLTTSYKRDRFEKGLILYRELARKCRELGLPEEGILRAQRQLFVLLRVVIAHERKRISGLPAVDSVRNIRRICESPLLREILHSYPIKALGFKQQFFLYLLQYRCSTLLYVLAQIRLL